MSSNQKRRTRRRPRTRGQALVEFAFVLPIFVLVLSGILDFGFMLFARMTVINAAREGARAAVTASDPTTIPSVATGAAQAVASGIGAASLGVTATCVAIVTTPGPCTFATTTGSKTGDAVSVTVTYTYHTFFPGLFGATFPLGSTVQMALE